MSENNNSPPLAQNEYVQELFAILQDTGKDTKGLTALISHVSEMENFVKRAEDKISDMKYQLAEMKEVQNHPVKAALQNAIKSLEYKVAQVKEQLVGFKNEIINGCKDAVSAFKEKGSESLNNIVKFFRIKSMLKNMDKSIGDSVAICDKALVTINRFSQEYHQAGKHLKNMLRVLIGKPSIDTAKETGKLAKAMSVPYIAEKAALIGIQKTANTLVAKLEQLETKAELKQSRRVIDKKPSILDELDSNIKMLAEQDRAKAPQERVKAKGAEL